MSHGLVIVSVIGMGFGFGTAACDGDDDDFEFDPNPPGTELRCGYSKSSPSGLGESESAEVWLTELVAPIERTVSRGNRQVSHSQYALLGGQLVYAQRDDLHGGAGGGPDGVMDQERRIERPEGKLVDTMRALPGGELLESTTSLLDDKNRVIRIESATGVIEYAFGPDGRTDRIDEDRIDPDTGASYTRSTALSYGPDERLLARHVTDSRLAAPAETTYEHEEVPDGLVVRRTTGGATATYRYGYLNAEIASGVEVDEDGDGIVEWTLGVDSGAFIERRNGEVTWEYTITRDCRIGFQAPYLLTRAPAPSWRLFEVPYPDPYQVRPAPL